MPPPRSARLFGLAGLIVFAMALGLGFLAGRYSDSFPSLRRATAVAKTAGGNEREAQTRRGTTGARESERAGRPAEPTPTLTFYQELTKPLTTPSPPPKPQRPARPERVDVRAERRPAEPRREASGEMTGDVRAERRPVVRAAGRSTAEASGEMTENRDERREASGEMAGISPAREASPGEGAFTVQVAAYRTRAQAEALRESLAAAGHGAYVVEAEAAGGPTYRVRVGAYATREAARAAAQAISTERQLQAYVTTR